jgi:hypothetical protein
MISLLLIGTDASGTQPSADPKLMLKGDMNEVYRRAERTNNNTARDVE